MESENFKNKTINCLYAECEDNKGNNYHANLCCCFIKENKTTKESYHIFPILCTKEDNESFKIMTPVCCLKQTDNSHTGISPICCFTVDERTNDFDIYSPIFYYSKEKKEKCLMTPICCYNKSKNTCFTSPMLCYLKNKKNKIIIQPIIASARYNKCNCDLFCFDYLLSNESMSHNDYYCSVCFCKFIKDKYVQGTSYNKEINDYIKEHNLRIQKTSFLTCLFITGEKAIDEPPRQLMSNFEVENILVHKKVKDQIQDLGGDGVNIANIIMDYKL